MTATDSPVTAIPSSATIRERLAELARERDLLRALLKLAMKKEKESGEKTAA
ncbi:MAG TPA: hypothetical protein VFE62_22690 [Gemmataceae bacterium]|nr:hypothetical protein [Gemmataceae bacterium]